MSSTPVPKNKNFNFIALALSGPFFFAMLLGFILLKKRQDAPRFLASPVPVSKAFWTDDGRVVGFSTVTPQANKLGTTHYLSWQLDGSKLESDVTHTSSAHGIFPAPGGKYWARVNRASARLQLLDTSKGFQQVGEFPLSADTSSRHTIYWSSSDQLIDIATGSRKTASVWNTSQRSRLPKESASVSKSLPWLQSEIQAIRISPNRKMALVQQASTRLPKSIMGITLSPNVTAGNRLSLISWPDCREIKRFDGDMYPTVGWSLDSKTVYAVVQLVGGETLQQAEIVRFDIPTRKTSKVEIMVSGVSGEILTTFEHAKFAPGGRFLLMGGADRKSTRLSQKWHVIDTTTGKNCGEIRPPNQTKPWFGFWNGANFSPDGRYLVQPLATGVEVWDMEQFG